MREKEIKEGLGELADRAERDHEVQMARADCYKIAKYAIKLHDMLQNVSEEQGLEGWVQSKITKAADYLGSVYHHLDYEQASGEINDNEVSVEEGKSPHKKGTKKYKKHMAAMHAESLEDRLAAKLESKKKTNEASLDKEIEYEKSRAELNKAHTARLKTAVDKEKEANKLKQLGHDASVARAKRYADRSKVKQGTRVYDERTLTKGEEGKREKYVKGMKKAKGDFKKRYGKDAEAVMYATATKMAKK